MITLSREKEIQQIENWETIISRAGFRNDLDPKSVKLEAIIGTYKFKDPVPCGLSGCHQPHNSGYLVVTDSGLETNMGNICGGSYFSVEFKVLRNRFNKDLQNKRRRETLQHAQFSVDGWKEEIEIIRNESEGADWCHGNIKKLNNKSLSPDVIVRTLSKMVRDKSGLIVRTRLSTKDEKELMEAQGGARKEFVEENIGFLKGFEAFYSENNLRDILIFNLEKGLRELGEVEVDLLSDSDLQRLVKWVADVESNIEQAKNSVVTHRALLEVGNIKQLREILETPEDKKLFDSLVKSFS